MTTHPNGDPGLEADPNGGGGSTSPPNPPATTNAPLPAEAAGRLPAESVAPRPRGMNGRNIRLLIVLVLILSAAAGYGGYWWFWVRGTVSTDDAYVDARIVSVASRLPEKVVQVRVREGARVKRGQLLVRFMSDQLRLEVRQMEAAVQGAEARLEERRNGARAEVINVAKAEVRVREVELTLRKKEAVRAEGLARVRAISAQELERKRSALDNARSELEVGRSKLALLQAGEREEAVRTAQADLALAKARLDAARAYLADSELRSPVDGVVARRQVDPGEVVQKGQALFQIVEAGRTWVVANLEEGQVTRIGEGQPVRLWIDAYPGREFRGRVGPVFAATLSRFSLLPSSSASGSFIKVTQRVPVRIDWTLSEHEDMPPMFPGLNVTVRIDVSGGMVAQEGSSGQDKRASGKGKK